MPATRILLSAPPFAEIAARSWGSQGVWPGRWIGPGETREGGWKFALLVEGPLEAEIHITGDHRYEFFVDGERVSRGPERGDLEHWAFETFRLSFGPGEHVLVAKVWWFGERSAFAQHGLRPGFLVSSADERLATGTGAWRVRDLAGIEWLPWVQAWGTGANAAVTSPADPGPWREPEILHEAVDARYPSERGRIHLLRPAILPPMIERRIEGARVRHVAEASEDPTALTPIRAADHLPEEAAAWQALLDGGSLRLSGRRRVLVDLDDYYCGRPVMRASGTGSVRVHWQEALLEGTTINKGDRNEIEGKSFAVLWSNTDGEGDLFRVVGDGGVFETPWWQAGRYVEIVAEGDLMIESFGIEETRYPFEREASYSEHPEVQKIAWRALQMCAHETYMDCPFYEQLQYIGDTRLQALVTFTNSRDDRLVRQALVAFDVSRDARGVTQSRYPSRVRQVIPPFSLWWVTMVRDFALWRGDPDFVRARMPGVRAVLDFYRAHLRPDGLLGATPGWNYVDWIPRWRDGGPPGAGTDPVSPLALQFVLALRDAAKVKEWLGEPELAARNRRTADDLAAATRAAFFRDGAWRNTLSPDDADLTEHAPALALIAGVSTPEEVRYLLDLPGEGRATIMYSHYSFEAFRLLRRGDVIEDRLALWHGLVANGLRTTVEMPEPTRSDCHAWGAHPLYHFLATQLGVRPSDWGFASVDVDPLLDGIEGVLPHPAGGNVRVAGSGGRWRIELPEGVSGTFRGRVPLNPGVNEVTEP